MMEVFTTAPTEDISKYFMDTKGNKEIILGPESIQFKKNLIAVFPVQRLSIYYIKKNIRCTVCLISVVMAISLQHSSVVLPSL
jgi:hypothetical protein